MPRTEIFKFASYRNYLKAILSEKVAANPLYSMRAFAKSLGLASSYLSEILNGLKPLTINRARIVSDRLKLKDDEAEYFELLVEYERTESAKRKNIVHQRLKEISQSYEKEDLSVDQFRLIADWYHYPILEMTQIDGIKLTHTIAAKRLGISPYEAEKAIERLRRLKLLEIDQDGELKKTYTYIVTKTENKNEALQTFHRQTMRKAIDSLSLQSPNERYFGSETFSFDPELTDAAKKAIDDFFSKLLQIVANSKKRSNVYHCGVQLFRMDQNKV